MVKRVSTTHEDETGRNKHFRDNFTGQNMTRSQFVKEIQSGNYPDYHVAKIHDKDTPRRNPDGNPNTNLD